jgi:cyclohexadienyl dehydratase
MSQLLWFSGLFICFIFCSSNVHAQDRLDRIRNTKTLRVGTTGDYNPFSILDPVSKRYRGLDIDLANDLAATLQVKLKLVPTSWPSLSNDIAADQFDVAMSGITHTPDRDRVAFFSKGYYPGGKTGLGRCSDKDRFDSLDKIDLPSVTVVVNAGGTNEKYVKEHIHKAKVVVQSDNNSCFTSLIRKQADVMITDAIEVRLQTRLHPDLCATMPGRTLNETEIAVMMVPDEALKQYVDAWLKGVERKRFVEETLNKYVN